MSSMLTQEISTRLAERLEQVENPDWYLHLFALALEDSLDYDHALALADAAVERQPHPPPSAEDEEDIKLLDALAMDEYLSSSLDIDADIDATPATSEEQPAVNLHFHEGAVTLAPQPAQQSVNVEGPPINITMPPITVQPAAVAPVTINVPEQPAPNVTVTAPNVTVNPPSVKITNVVETPKVEVNVPETKPMTKTAQKGADGKWLVKETPA